MSAGTTPLPTPTPRSWSISEHGGLSPVVQPLLTDLYQLTMCYGYWKANKHNETAVFDLYFRKNPFGGEFTIFCGLEEAIAYVESFKFSDSDLIYLREQLTLSCPSIDPKFFDYLKNLDCRNVKIWAINEGSVVFPHIPLLVVEGPLAVVQLLETTLLNLINFSSLVCTNAARFRLAAGPKVTLLEFGIRRAQGPNGALSASKYCYVGGFDATSNVLAGKLYGIPIKGTHAHAFVSAFTNQNDLTNRALKYCDGKKVEKDFYELASSFVPQIAKLCECVDTEVQIGERTAFCAYAIAFPTAFLALIDTYDIMKSGIINYCAISVALHKLGYKSVGVRIDSGDLAFMSIHVRKCLLKVSTSFDIAHLAKSTIVVSNDINEEIIYSLHEQRNEIDCYGVGTHLVTCQKQPALGCVYKLVNLGTTPRIKLSQQVDKISLPGKKRAFRLYGKGGLAINDIILLDDEPEPKVSSQPILCRHPFQEPKRAFVQPSHIECLHLLVFKGKRMIPPKSLDEIKKQVQTSLGSIRQDIKRHLNPTPYKVSVSEKVYKFLHTLWLQHVPIGKLE